MLSKTIKLNVLYVHQKSTHKQMFEIVYYVKKKDNLQN